MRWACNTCENYVVSPSARIHTEALRGHMRSDLSLIGSFKCFWLEKFLCFLFHLWKHVEKTFVGETEWILFTIQEFNLTCKQTADGCFCLECTEELKTILEENMNTFCSIDTLGLCCTSACCGPNEFYTNKQKCAFKKYSPAFTGEEKTQELFTSLHQFWSHKYRTENWKLSKWGFIN